MRRIAILCGVIGVTVATARPGVADTLNVSVGSSIERTFFVDADTDALFTMRNQGRAPATACCFYVNRNGHCSNTPTQICFGKNSCGPRDVCINGCVAKDFRFDIPAKSKVPPGANVVQWSAKDGLINVTLLIPPVDTIPFFGDLICDVIAVGGTCPGDLGQNPCL